MLNKMNSIISCLQTKEEDYIGNTLGGNENKWASGIYDVDKIYDIINSSTKDKAKIENAFIRVLNYLIMDDTLREYAIKYCWFNPNDGIIYAPVMIGLEDVKIFLHGGANTYELCRVFDMPDNCDFCTRPFSKMKCHNLDVADSPAYVSYKLDGEIVKAFKKADKEGLFEFPIKLNLYE